MSLLLSQVSVGVEVFVIVCLFALVALLVFGSLFFYTKVTERHSSTVTNLHELHKDERREWNKSNQTNVVQVEKVLRELTTVIHLANNRQTFQINNNGSTGTQDQKGDNNA